MAKAKKVSGGVEGMLDEIHERIQRDAESQGLTWCHHWGHEFRKPGITCKQCVHQLCLVIAFWRSMGVQRERDMP